MTDKNSPDRFSAFHDGELFAAEAETLRGELTSSAEARREVDEYQQLSRLLNELPTERVGEEFPAAVLQAVERSMLLPVADELAVAPRGRQSRGRWLSAIAAFAASAAALFVAVKLLEKPDRNEAVSVAEGQPAQPKSEPERGVASDDAVAFGEKAKATGSAGLSKVADAKPIDSSEPEVLAKSATPAAPRQSSARPFGSAGYGTQPSNSSVDDYDKDAKDAPQESVETPSLTQLDGPSPPMSFKEKLNNAEVGQVVEALVRSDDKISVVRLTVVDRIVGLQQLQLLLSDNSFADAGEPVEANAAAPQTRDRETVDKRAKGAESDAKDHAEKSQLNESTPPASGDEVYCVLINTDTEQLANALTQLDLGRQFQDLRVQDPPLAVAELDDESYSGFDFNSNGQLSQRLESHLVQKILKMPQQADKVGDHSGADSGEEQKKRVIEKSPPVKRNFKAQAADQAKESTQVVQSQQLSMKIPSRVLQKADNRQLARESSQSQVGLRNRAMKKLDSQPQVATDSKSQSLRAPAAQAAPAKKELQKNPVRPVRVLLVLEDRHQVNNNSAPAGPAAEEPKSP